MATATARWAAARQATTMTTTTMATGDDDDDDDGDGATGDGIRQRLQKTFGKIGKGQRMAWWLVMMRA